jgi:hypothetical protein
MSTCETKRVFVIQLLNKGEKPLLVGNEYCYSNLQIDYNVLYYPIVFKAEINDDITEFYKDVDTHCDATIIFADLDMHDETKEKKILVKLQNLLKKIKNFTNARLYIKNRKESASYLTSQFLLSNGITGLKAYHIILERVKSVRIRQIGGLNIIRVPENVYLAKNDELQCQFWFEHALLKAFHCGLRRLQQLSGTCYLNTSINALFLTPYFRDIFDKALSIISSETKARFDALTLACPTYDMKTSLDYLLFLYYRLFNQGDVLVADKDIMREAGEQFFETMDADKRRGGSVVSVLSMIFASLGLNYVVKLPKSFLFRKMNYVSFNKGLTPERFESFTSSINKEANDIIQNRLLNINEDIDIIIDWKTNGRFHEKEMLFIEPFRRGKYFDEIYYDLQFSIIRLSFADNSIGHVILGFFCNGYPRVYDSNTNLIFDFDWRSININLEMKAKFLSRLSPFYVNISDVYLLVEVYTKSQTVEKTDLRAIDAVISKKNFEDLSPEMSKAVLQRLLEHVSRANEELIFLFLTIDENKTIPFSDATFLKLAEEKGFTPSSSPYVLLRWVLQASGNDVFKNYYLEEPKQIFFWKERGFPDFTDNIYGKKFLEKVLQFNSPETITEYIDQYTHRKDIDTQLSAMVNVILNLEQPEKMKWDFLCRLSDKLSNFKIERIVTHLPDELPHILCLLKLNKSFDINTLCITNINATPVNIFQTLVPKGLRISQFVDKILNRELNIELLELVLAHAKGKQIPLNIILNGLIFESDQVSPTFEYVYVETDLIDLRDIISNKASNKKVIQYLKNFHGQDLMVGMESEDDSDSEDEGKGRKRTFTD